MYGDDRITKILGTWEPTSDPQMDSARNSLIKAFSGNDIGDAGTAMVRRAGQPSYSQGKSFGDLYNEARAQKLQELGGLYKIFQDSQTEKRDSRKMQMEETKFTYEMLKDEKTQKVQGQTAIREAVKSVVANEDEANLVFEAMRDMPETVTGENALEMASKAYDQLKGEGRVTGKKRLTASERYKEVGDTLYDISGEKPVPVEDMGMGGVFRGKATEIQFTNAYIKHQIALAAQAEGVSPDEYAKAHPQEVEAFAAQVAQRYLEAPRIMSSQTFNQDTGQIETLATPVNRPPMPTLSGSSETGARGPIVLGSKPPDATTVGRKALAEQSALAMREVHDQLFGQDQQNPTIDRALLTTMYTNLPHSKGAQLRQALLTAIQNQIYLKSGQQISIQELDRNINTYMPKPWDRDDLVFQKIDFIDALFSGMLKSYGAAGQPSEVGPQPGTIEDGHRFKGGDPADPANWEAE